MVEDIARQPSQKNIDEALLNEAADEDSEDGCKRMWKDDVDGAVEGTKEQ